MVEALFSDSIFNKKHTVYIKEFCLDLKSINVHFFSNLLMYGQDLFF